MDANIAPQRVNIASEFTVECIGKGKASTPYEFGVKASIVTSNARGLNS